MAVPTFVGAGTGVAVLTGNGSASKTSCTADNLIIVHLVCRGNDYGFPFSITNIKSLDGTATSIGQITVDRTLGTGNVHSLYIGRAMSDGTCTAAAAAGAGSEDVFFRVYEFSGVYPGTDNTGVGTIENSATTFASAAGTSTSVLDTGVVTSDVQRLALQFVGLASNQAIGDFTGETGGDWAEIAEYQDATGSTATLQLQSASMAAAGTIDGGAVTVSSVGWGVIGLALIPASVGQTILPDADVAAGGWTTSPLFSKVNDSSDATIITATAS